MNPLQLALIQPPFDDEGLLGYLYRLARLNAVSGAELLAAFRGMKPSEVDTWMAYQQTPQSWKLMANELLDPETRPSRVWDCRHHKFCPGCIKAYAHWRVGWNLMLVNGCIRHRTVLLDSCTSCGRRLHAESMRTLCCEYCGHELADSGYAVSDADVGTLWLARELECRLLPSAGLGAGIASHLSLAEFHELALRFGVRGMNADRGRPISLKGAGVAPYRRTITEMAGMTLMDWPQSFYHLLDRIRARRSEKPTWKISRCLGPIYSDIYRYLGSPNLNFVRSAFENYLRDYWDAPLALRNRNLNTELILQHRWLSVEEAAREVEVDPSLLKRMADAGEISSKTFTHESGRVFRVIDISMARSLSSSIKSVLTVEQAAIHAGLKKQRIRELLDAGLLSVLGGKPSSGARWWIDALSIDRLSDGAVLSDMTHKSVSLAHLLKYRLNGQQEFIALIKAIRAAQLKVFVSSENPSQVGAWLLDEDELDIWLASIRTSKESTLSVVEVAAKLRVKQEVAYGLVRTGLLKSKPGRHGRREHRLVTTAMLQQFRRRFVLGTEMADISGRSPKILAYQLQTTGFLPVAGPTLEERKCRQYVWRRTKKLMSHVANLAVSYAT